MTLAPAELVPAEARSEEQSLPPRKRGEAGDRRFLYLPLALSAFGRFYV